MFVYDGAAALQHQQDGDRERLSKAVSLTMIGPQHTLHTSQSARQYSI